MKKFEAKKSLSFKHKVKGLGTIDTTCKTFGNPVTKGTGIELVSLCGKCKQEDSVKHACLVKSGKLVINAKKVRLPGEKIQRGPRGPQSTEKDNPFAIVVIGLAKGWTKDKILVAMNKAGVSEKNAKNKFSSVSCCYRALTGEAKKEGAVMSYANWIIDGRVGDPPAIDGSSRSYVEKTYAVLNQYKLIQAE